MTKVNKQAICVDNETTKFVHLNTIDSINASLSPYIRNETKELLNIVSY